MGTGTELRAARRVGVVAIMIWLTAPDVALGHRIPWGEGAPESVLEAVSTIRRAATDGNLAADYCRRWGAGATSQDVTSSGVVISCSNGQTHEFLYRARPRPDHMHYCCGGQPWGVFMSRTSQATELNGQGRDSLERVLAAWHFLAVPPPPRDPVADQRFLDQLALASASAADRSEDMRRAQLQAESLLQSEHPEEAALAYNAALRDMPHWAVGHFNLALVSARLEYYTDAITAMRRYLYLEPNAPDARAAQDMIYQWEGQLEAQ